MKISSENIEAVLAEELRYIPGSVFALGKVGEGDKQELAGHDNDAGFVIATWTSIETADAARFLLPDAAAWEVVGLLFNTEGFEGVTDFAPVSAEH